MRWTSPHKTRWRITTIRTDRSHTCAAPLRHNTAVALMACICRAPLPAFLLLTILACPVSAAENKLPAPAHYSAAMSMNPETGAPQGVQIVSGGESDYYIDAPYIQFISENPPQGYAQSPQFMECATDEEPLVFDWAAPLPDDEIVCALRLEGGESGAWQMSLLAARTGIMAHIDNGPHRFKMFFSGDRWLPAGSEFVLNMAAYAGDPFGILAATELGVSFIAWRPATLEQKALAFEHITQARHSRDGMISDCALQVPGDTDSFKLRDDDNDGQWSEMYLAAESFRWAATGDPAARENAQRTFRAMIKLLTIAPVKGLPARSVLPAAQCPGADPHNWRMSADGTECWKSDTSVDELVGHYFGLPVYYDLVADDGEKQIIRSAIADLTDYIVDNGMRLLDENGNVTTHGNWDPEWVNTVGRTGDQGLNSVQALNALRSAHHITGNPKYLDKYHELVSRHGYHKNALKWKETGDRFQVNHDSDEMGFLSFYNLLRYEDDESLRRYYLEGLRRAWENDLPERNPEQIVIYGAFAKKNYGLDLAVRTLREIPLDLVKWSVRNSGRADLPHDTAPDRFGRAQSIFVPPYSETRTIRWSENMYQLDTDDGGRSEAMPVFWLLPYWMARYHGMIRNS